MAAVEVYTKMVIISQFLPVACQTTMEKFLEFDSEKEIAYWKVSLINDYDCGGI